jgi:hypothetical protein
MVVDRLSEGGGVRSPQVRLSARWPESLVDWISYGEARLYQGKFIRCQSDHGDHVYFCGRVAMLGGDETDSST